MKNNAKDSNSELGNRLHCEVKGDANKPALLLIHGFLSSNLQWALNEDELKKHFRLFMVELWGHGHSPAPANVEYYTIARYIDEIEKIRKLYRICQWGLLGQSFGAGVVLHYARTKPEYCSGLVLTNSISALGRTSASKLNNQIETTLRERGVRELPFHAIFGKRIPSPLKEKMVIQADAVAIDSVINGLRLAENLSIQPYIENLEAPALLINGIYEKAFQQVVENIKPLWQDLKIKDVKGGHAVNIDCPKEFNKYVIKFLSACSGK
jgi:2-succinyl-6-hydroxy-2,4-cyclohexadiene-1-carboxylate synthase